MHNILKCAEITCKLKISGSIHPHLFPIYMSDWSAWMLWWIEAINEQNAQILPKC
jgi:hypothetical protein